MKTERTRNSVVKRVVVITLLLLCIMAMGKPATAKAAMSGGWSVNKTSTSFVTKSQKKIFKKSVKGLTGVTYKPVALLAQQVVAGTNYVFLCQGTTTTAKPSKGWYILTVSKDLKNKVSLRSAKKIKIASVKTAKNPRTKTVSGGLTIKAVKNKSAALPKAARKPFKKALKNYTGYELRPIALLGKQVVAGTNFKILCYGKNYASKDLFVVIVNKDVSGKCRIKSCKPLKLEGYTK